ncbi:hypothetical protein [Caballeronia sp.]|uniref:hypothetical protein n=1 Tax=Caballeronia sp. TaxID=1931223 RepID=UPI003C493DAA
MSYQKPIAVAGIRGWLPGFSAYLKKYRLEGVRRDMLADRSERNISSIAMGWGSCVSGVFSATTGSSPSQTLKRVVRR